MATGADTAAVITTSIEENPFYVLDLQTSASPKNVEKQKQKLLGMLELGLASAKTFSTPLGTFERSEDSIRRAAAALENPIERIGWELWVESTADSSTEMEDLGNALVLHYDMQKRALQGDFDDADFVAFNIDALGAAWDAVADGELLSVLEERTVEEYGVDGDDIFHSFLEQVTTDLAELIEAAPVFDLDNLESEIAMEAADRLYRRASELLESMVQRFVAQCEDRGTIAGQGTWNSLRDQYKRLTAGRGHYMRVLCFDAVYDPVSDLAIEAFEQEEYLFAEALFIWLRDEAAAAGSDDVSAQQAENASIAAAANEPNYDYEQEAESSGSAFSGWWALFIVFILVRVVMRADCASNDNDYSQPPYEIDEAVREQIMRDIRLREPSEYMPDTSVHYGNPLEADPAPSPDLPAERSTGEYE